jgi:hypothetical protein
MHRDPDVAVIQRFESRLRALALEDWERLAEDAAPLRGESIQAVWRRAELDAIAEMPDAAWARVPAQIVGVGAALIEELEPGLVDAGPCISVHDLRKPGGRRYLELLADIHDLLEANRPGDDGTAAAVLGATLALAERSGLSDGDLRRAYRYVEATIPLQSLLDEPA